MTEDQAHMEMTGVREDRRGSSPFRLIIYNICPKSKLPILRSNLKNKLLIALIY